MEKNRDYFSCTSQFEVREMGEEKQLGIQGYALRFNSMSEDLGYREVIALGALDDTDLSDVILTFNHSEDKVLARNNKQEGTGSLKLTVDSQGLFFEAIPTDTTYSRDLIENIKNGVIDKCSFRFRIDWSDKEAQKWDWDDGIRGYDLRTIKKIKKIVDVSLVTFPAYSQSSVTTYKRAKEEAEQERNLAKEREVLAIELGL